MSIDDLAPDWRLPSPQDGETIYSVCARFHVAGSRVDSRVTSSMLLGHSRGSPQHDIPRGLDQLAKVSGGLLAASEKELRSRTVLRAYLPFMNSAQRLNVLNACTSVHEAALHAVRTRFSWQISRAHELRYCPHCFEQQRAQFGHGFWQVEDQLPGAWACTDHCVPLLFCPMRNKEKIGWVTVEALHGRAAAPSLCQGAICMATRVTSCIKWIGNHAVLHPAALAGMARKRVHEAGLSRSEFVISDDEIRRLHDGLEDLVRSGIADFEGLGSLAWMRELTSDHYASHPLRWAALLATAGGVELGELEQNYLDAMARLPQREFFSTASRRASAPLEMYSALGGPTTLRQAAEELGISLSELRGWVRRDQNLQIHWKQSAQNIKQRAAIFAIESYLMAHPSAHRREVLHKCLWAVRVVERYARGLLDSLLPPERVASARQFERF